MLQRRLLVAALLLAPVALAGCVNPVTLGSQSPTTPAALDASLVDVPAGAALETVANGLALVWEDHELPFEETLKIPEGTTLVRASATLADEDLPLHVSMKNAETGRRRCNTPYVQAWNVGTTGHMTCSGLTAVDRLPAEWTVTVRAGSNGVAYLSPSGAVGEGGPALAQAVRVEFLAVPLDGLVADLDLSKLSMPDHDVKEPEVVWIESFDGTRLYAELTLPEGEGPWPTVIASSPYNGRAHAAGEWSMWEYFTHDWAKRGYAILNVDVRGFGNSGGCVEVWGPNEQKDQAFIVDWVAAQAWSDGNVGFYGQSYVGTTPTAAAVQAPEALKAIIAVAPVINAYDDWHFGGVPNGENALSPVAYQVLTDGLNVMPDPRQTVMNHVSSLCDPTLIVRANDPRAVYDAFYEERNFTLRAKDVKAAVLYTEGFEDSNVKSSMITHWFNAIEAPKLGLFGHWVHQHPPRADTEVLFLGWMDQYVKGRDLGFGKLPDVAVVTNNGLHRTADAWPPTDAADTPLFVDFAKGAFTDAPKDGSFTFLSAPAREVSGAVTPSMKLDAPVYASGNLRVHLKATLAGAENAHVAAFLYDEGPDGSVLVTWGMANLAHRFGHDRYEPVAPGEVVRMDLPLLPTEHVFEEGHTLRLVIRAADPTDWAAVTPATGGALTLHGGEDGTALVLPTLPLGAAEPLPVTAVP